MDTKCSKLKVDLDLMITSTNQMWFTDNLTPKDLFKRFEFEMFTQHGEHRNWFMKVRKGIKERMWKWEDFDLEKKKGKKIERRRRLVAGRNSHWNVSCLSCFRSFELPPNSPKNHILINNSEERSLALENVASSWGNWSDWEVPREAPWERVWDEIIFSHSSHPSIYRIKLKQTSIISKHFGGFN